MTDVLLAFSLTLVAGLSTVIGSVIALLKRTPSPRFLATSLGFSAGVMIYVSFVELLPAATDHMQAALGERRGAAWVTLAFFAGMLLIAAIDQLVPHEANPHEFTHHDDASERAQAACLLRMGGLLALALGIHNLPEGMATFLTALENSTLAVPLVIAIGLHNIPEGIAVSVPIHLATGSRFKAFAYSAASGLAEPVGALLAYLVLRPFLGDAVMAAMLAAVAGVMVFISLDKLLPTAEEFGEHHRAVYGLVGGMAFMSLSLLLL